MMAWLNRLLHDYLVLFAMVNAVGNLPIFAELTRDMDAGQRKQAFRIAILTASSIVICFAFLGDWLLRSVFQVDPGAFKIAGGILVFIVAARGVLAGARTDARGTTPHDQIAVFPMGFPYLAGPGTIVTTILLLQNQGRIATAAAAVLVYATITPLLYLAPLVERAIGRVGVLVVARLLYVFICAKAVSFVLSGINSAL